MPLMRRRPLARAAMVGGAAYYAGKRAERGQQAEYDQDARIAELEAQQSYAAPAAPSGGGGMSQEAMAKLTQLAQLHEQGVLTDAEFEVQKQRILQGI